ncbi:conserved Plasmodium protein, unknown function [Plasmodium vivax]|nr:unnamed protein product [Plasmodium vivax]SCO66632.1 conserved Plasmodium protein, unknown function [Plasmodium vivax]SCO72064.1 conserved Plasmodium protein, unknown function [Plasmodium vivax]
MTSVMAEVGAGQPGGGGGHCKSSHVSNHPSNGANAANAANPVKGSGGGGGHAELMLRGGADLARGVPRFPPGYNANALAPPSTERKTKSREDMHTEGNAAIEEGIPRTRNCSQKKNNHGDERTKDARGSKKIFCINGKKKCAKKSGTQNDCVVNEWDDEQTNCNLKNEEICFFGGDQHSKMDDAHVHGKYKSVSKREGRQGRGKKITSNGHLVRDVKQSAHVGDTPSQKLSDKKDGSAQANHVDRANKPVETSASEQGHANREQQHRGALHRGRRNHYSDAKLGREQPNGNYYDKSDYVKRERVVDHYKKLDGVYPSHSGRRSNRGYHQRGSYRNEPTGRGTTDRWHRYYPKERTSKAAEGGRRDRNGITPNSGHSVLPPLNNPPQGSNMGMKYPNEVVQRGGKEKTTFSHSGEHEKGRQTEVRSVQVDHSADSLQENFAHRNEVPPSKGKTLSQLHRNEKSEEHFTNGLQETSESTPTVENTYLNELSPINMAANGCRGALLEREIEGDQSGPFYIHRGVRNNDVVEVPREEPNWKSTNNHLEKKVGPNEPPSGGGTNQKDTPPMGGSPNANDNLRKLKREEEKKKVMNWKLEEQTLLEEGLRVYKDLKNCPEKWEKVSEIVKTKGPEDCLKRFLYCRFVVLKEKQKMEKELQERQRGEREEPSEVKPSEPNQPNEPNDPNEEGSEQANEELEQDIDSDDMNINNNANITGKSLVLGNVHIKNISLYKAVQLKLQLLCTRCCNTFDVTTTSKDAPQLVCTCANCSSSAVVEVYRNICFMENSCVCVLKFNQCSLMDLLSGDYSVNCESCGRKSILKNVTSGKEMHANCQKCFTKLEFKYSGFSFDEIVSANNAAIKKIDEMINKLFTKKKSSKKAVAAPNNLKIEKCKNVIKVNNIEVKDGACKHFKKSHRLFKFPCCNKIFPCPTCHDLNSNHECGIAKRVICGFCFREFDDDDVCVCQRDKKAKKGGNFWEGGKGCRNAVALSRNDSKKYKLLNRQTVQKKKKK